MILANLMEIWYLWTLIIHLLQVLPCTLTIQIHLIHPRSYHTAYLKTINELAKTGYKNLTDKMFYNDNLTFDKILKNESKVVISINGSELVKGRGGPRCMTLPINRGQI